MHLSKNPFNQLDVFVCSASRSQFLTGRHSYHNGYGTLDVIDHGDALYHGSCNYIK